jgi:16S rRNA (uracil1498-N3)-methyltransferase
LFLPKLNQPIAYSAFLKNEFIGCKFIAHCEETNKKSLKKELKPNQNTLILIGPEGDFSSKEIQLALDSKFIPVSLGNNRLRTETAAIVACTTYNLINEK